MKTKLNKLFFSPFEYISDYKTLFIGIVAIILSGLLNYFAHIRFDGLLDIHFSGNDTSLLVCISEGLINWLLISILLFCAGRIFSSSTIRFIDVIGTQAMARWPLFIAVLAAIVIPHQSVQGYLMYELLKEGPEINIPVYEFILFGLLALIMLAVVIWMVILMYRGFVLLAI